MTGIADLLPQGFLERSMVRETARQTASLVARKIQTTQVTGATITAAVPMSGIVSVHLDGDPPGQSVQLSSASWQFYDTGQRVLVLLAPPSFATLIGPMGPPAVWTPYGTDPNAAIFTTDAQKQPVATSLTAAGIGLTPSGATSSTLSAISIPAGRLVIIAVGIVGSNTNTPTVSSVSNATAPQTWLAGPTRSNTGGSGGSYVVSNSQKHVAMFSAYFTEATVTDITVNYAGNTTGAVVTIDVISMSNAKQLQTGAATATGIGTDVSNGNLSITTIDDHSTIVGIVADGGALSLLVTAGASTTFLRRYDSSVVGGEYRGIVSANRQVAAAGASALNYTFNNGSANSMAVAAMEVLGVPDVPVAGNGNISGYYRLRDKSMEIRAAFNAGSTSSFGGGTYRLALPPGFTASPRPVGLAPMTLSGIMRPTTAGSPYRVLAGIAPGAAYFDRILYQDNSTQYLDPTHPTTLDAGFYIGLNGVIEVA